jgi:hypothetical protein
MSERESAETLALKALTWLAEDRDRMGAFLSETGASVGDLATQAGDPAFLGAVLDHLLTSDALVTGFCDAEGLAYDRPMRARAALPGGAQWHWT